MLKPRGQEESVLSKAQRVATRPVTLSAAAFAAVLSVSEAVAAKMIAYGIEKPGDIPSLVVDDVEPTGASKDAVCQPTVESDVIGGGKPLVYKDRIYAGAQSEVEVFYDIFDTNLNKQGQIPVADRSIDEILGEKGIGVSGGFDSTLYALSPSGFEKKGMTDLSGEFRAYGGYLFYTNLHDNGGTYGNTLNVIHEDDVLANQDPNGKIPDAQFKVDDVVPASNPGNGIAVDHSVSPAVVLVSTQKLDGALGYMEVPLPDLDADGHLPPPATWGSNYNFVQTGYKIDQIHVDNTTGDRYLLSDGNINIETFDGLKYEIHENMFPNGVKQMFVFEGRLVVIENGGTKPIYILRTTNPAYETIPGIPFAIYESKDFPGGGSLGVISGGVEVEESEDLCPPGGEDDFNACTDDYCDPATGEISNVPVNTDDGDECTDDDCDPVTGVVTHTQKPIDDANACTGDDCDPATGNITHTPVDTNDNNACTADSCDPATGAITHTQKPIEDDDNECTLDGCDSTTGQATHIPQEGAACGENGTCDSDGVCVPAVQPDDATPDKDPDVVEPSPDVYETTDPDVVEGTDGGELTAEEVASADIPEAETEVEVNEDGTITEVGDTAEDEGTEPDTTKPDTNPDVPPTDTAKPDTATPDKGPNEDASRDQIAEVLGEQTGQDAVDSDVYTPESDERTPGGGCTTVPEGVKNTREGIAAIFALAMAALSRRRKEGAQVE